jgi:hypothetical protein
MFLSKNLMLKSEQSCGHFQQPARNVAPLRRHRRRLPDAEELVPHAPFLLIALTSILQPPASLGGQRGRQLFVETCGHKMVGHLSAVSLFARFI